MHSLLSREALFLINNLLFMGILVVCFWGVIFPLVSELFTGQKVTVGPPFYNRATGPLFRRAAAADGGRPAFGLASLHRQNPRPRASGDPFLASLVVLGRAVRRRDAQPGRPVRLLVWRPSWLWSPCMSTGAADRARHRTRHESYPCGAGSTWSPATAAAMAGISFTWGWC